MGAQVSRKPPPPLPGGYVLGEQVYYTGTSETFEDGDRLEHGEQGEVVGPAIWKSHRGKGVAVSFPGCSKDLIICYLNHVRRRRRRTATRAAPAAPCSCTSSQSITHYIRVALCGRTGKPRAAAAAGRLRAG